MKSSVPRPVLLLALSGALLAGGCSREDAGAARAPGAGETDTTNPGALDGLSTQQVEEQARALTPEEAAAMGMEVDTTIHVESMTSPEDSALVGGARPQPPPQGAVPAPDSARDTVPR